MKLLATLICFSFFIVPFFVIAQSMQDSSAYIKVRQYAQHPNVYSFSVANEPPLIQIAGAPQANYGYFWEFGDGDYSFEKEPTHVYTDSTGKEKKVVVSLTNNYGSGGAPRLRPKKIKPENSKSVPEAMLKRDGKEPSPLSKNESIHLFTNHSPKAEDPIVCVLSYRNVDDLLPENGRIYLFYNEKEYDYDNFIFEETRTHYGEIFHEGLPQEVFTLGNQANDDEFIWASVATEDVRYFAVNPYSKTHSIPNALPLSSSNSKEKIISEGKKAFKNAVSWEYSNLQRGEKRNIFTSFLCSPEMVTDTSKIITIRAVVVPENKETREYSLKMVIQSSHDPNKISVSDRKIRKSMIKRNGIVYKVQFQNVGKGAARNIRIVNDLHESLDPASIELIDYYPKASLCLNSDSATHSCLDSAANGQQVEWLFKNIYLPGTRQDDRENRKATKGWVEFSVKPKDRFRRRNLIDARSLIYFDKNEPISTNRVKTKVEQNWSFGAKAGFAEVPFDFDFMMLGATFSSFHPRSFYLQPEVMISSLSHEGFTRSVDSVFVLTPDGNEAFGNEITKQSFEMLYFDLVPLQIRKNITPFASIGAGFQVSFLLKAKEIVTVDRSFYAIRQTNFEEPYPPYSQRDSYTVYNRFKGINEGLFSTVETGFFLDVQGGLVRKGPSLGLRYQTRTGKRPVNEETSERQTNSTLQVYVHMRF